MHTKVAIVLIERLQRGDIWNIFDHLIDPLDALDHLVSTKIDFFDNLLFNRWTTTKAASHPKKNLIEYFAYHDESFESNENTWTWKLIKHRTTRASHDDKPAIHSRLVIWIRLKATWIEILPDFGLSSLVNNLLITWLNFFRVWFATCYQYPQ